MSDSIDKAIAAVERRKTDRRLQRQISRAIWRAFVRSYSCLRLAAWDAERMG
jgi:hypothetical protein